MNGWMTSHKNSKTNSKTSSSVVTVFDWDNTCIYHDTSLASFRYLLEGPRLRLTPPELDQLFKNHISGHEAFKRNDGSSKSEEQNFPSLDLCNDILTAYHKLWDVRASASLFPQSTSNILMSPDQKNAHCDFQSKMMWLYEKMEECPDIGPRKTYGWLASLFGGYSHEEIERLAQYASLKACRQQPGKEMIRNATKGLSGDVHVSFETGLGAIPEMRQLNQKFQDLDFQNYVVSASCEYVVRGMVKEWDYPIPSNNIFGIRLSQDANSNRCLAQVLDDYPVSDAEGKVQIIQSFLPSPPKFVAGDSSNDYNMLTRFPETELRLVIYRKQQGSINKLQREGL